VQEYALVPVISKSFATHINTKIISPAEIVMTTSAIYLDNNATTRALPEVIETVARISCEQFANPGSRHRFGRDARKVLEDSREQIAAILGAQPSEVIFTSGGTEATNIAIKGFTTNIEPGKIILTEGEHAATLETCKQLVQRGFDLDWLKVDSAGRLRADQLVDCNWDNLKLVTLILAHNETGVIQDVESIANYCVEHAAPLHLDGVQAVGKIPVNFRQLQATSLSAAAHKFHGPRGVGLLLLKQNAKPLPLMHGGHQEQGIRPGTEAVALIAGMATALNRWYVDHIARTEQLCSMRDQLQAGLTKQCQPTVVNGSLTHRLPNTLNIAFPGLDGEALLVALDLAGIACSLGSTCASGSTEPTPVLKAMNCPADVIAASVRFSVSIDNTPAEINTAIERIAKVVKRLRA